MSNTVVRWTLLLAVVVAGAGAGCGRRGNPPPAPLPPAGTLPVPPVAESPVDYPTFRRQFRTRTREAIPAPQAWSPVPVAEGAREIEYLSDGRALRAWVNEEATRAQERRPAVLWLHGGFTFAREDWDQTAAFRRAGYHVLVPILRGENGQPGHFTLFADEIDDVLAAADTLAELKGVDRANLFVAGHEAGGTLALLAALSTDRFRAAAPISAMPDCGRLVATRPAIAPFDPDDANELLLRSPAAFAAFLRCPVRAYFGSGEAPYVEEDNQRMAERARAAGRDVETVRVLGDQLSCVRPATERAVEFFADIRKSIR